MAASNETSSDVANSRFLKACRREPTDCTPVWLMRQAGRYQPQYRKIRDKVDFLTLCKSPDLAAEVTVMAVETLGVDAAILFADLLPILEPMGLKLEYVKGDGPVIHNPVRDRASIDALRPVNVHDSQGFVFEAIKKIRKAIPATPLIGFAGAPFTLASYMIEGGSSREQARTKRLLYSEPEAWKRLMQYLARIVTSYLQAQIAAGVQAVQLFDSWVGSLDPRTYREHVLPHTRSIIAAVREQVPVIYFGTNTATLLPAMKEAGAQVLGLDFRNELGRTWDQLGDIAIQGNLDPVIVQTNARVIRDHVERILAEAGDRPGHIFNLGHGILQETPPENAKALVDIVHEVSTRRLAARAS